MAKIKIVQYGNPVLEKKSEIVTDPTTQEIKDLVNRMLEAVKTYGDGAAGLSAPQIGVLKQVAICRRFDLEERAKTKKGKEWEVMINPVIIQQSNEYSTNWEGCLSINFGDLFGKVTRPKEIEVEYLDLEGERKKIKANDYFAHVIQHEIDHLNGVLFIKYISDPAELYTSEELEDR